KGPFAAWHVISACKVAEHRDCDRHPTRLLFLEIGHNAVASLPYPLALSCPRFRCNWYFQREPTLCQYKNSRVMPVRYSNHAGLNPQMLDSIDTCICEDACCHDKEMDTEDVGEGTVKDSL